MSETPYTYPFDPSGSRIINRIEGEKQVLSPPAWRDFHFLIPKLAPFFQQNFKIRHEATGRFLEEGVDFAFTHRFYGASKAIMKPVYGSILFFDKTLAGVVELEYQTLGGEWTIDGAKITEILAQKQLNPRITQWEQVAAVPQQFPVIDHEWDLTDMVGMGHVKDSLDRLASTVETTGVDNSSFIVHRDSRNNPHGVTKAQIELGSVQNFPIATRAQALGGTYDEAYMTPRRVRQAFERFIEEVNNRITTLEEALGNRLEAIESQHQATTERLESRIDNLEDMLTSQAQSHQEQLEGLGQHVELLMANVYTKEEVDSLLAKLEDNNILLQRLMQHLGDAGAHSPTPESVNLGAVANRTLATAKDLATFINPNTHN